MPNKVKFKGGPNFQWYLLTGLLFAWDIYYGIAWLASNLATVAAVYLYFRYRREPIIKSLLDTDWYKLTMGQLVFHKFPNATAKYHFINRGKTQFPENFDKELRKEIKALGKLRLSLKEAEWLDKFVSMKLDYVLFLESFRFKPKQVTVVQTGGDLNIDIEGPWKEAILWEVPLMAIVSELYFRMTGKTYDNDAFILKTNEKAVRMHKAGIAWSDFGTRRRFSHKTQDALNKVMSTFGNKGFIGTSNPYFAMKYDVNPIGTYAHEAVMAMQALHGAKWSNRRWMEYWLDEYFYHMRIALTDTLTTDVFLRDFDEGMGDKFAGVRQDSGDPFEFAEKLIAHYKKLGINPNAKKIVFSDSLDTDKAIALHEKFGREIQCVMGIGTHLSNDCGHKPLNMVIKLTDIDFGDGMVPVVKLSDDAGKHTGLPEKIASIKTELGLLHSCVS